MRVLSLIKTKWVCDHKHKYFIASTWEFEKNDFDSYFIDQQLANHLIALKGHDLLISSARSLLTGTYMCIKDCKASFGWAESDMARCKVNPGVYWRHDLVLMVCVLLRENRINHWIISLYNVAVIVLISLYCYNMIPHYINRTFVFVVWENRTCGNQLILWCFQLLKIHALMPRLRQFSDKNSYWLIPNSEILFLSSTVWNKTGI